MIVTVVRSPPGLNSTFGSVEEAPTKKLSDSSTRPSSVRGILMHLRSLATDPRGNTTTWGVARMSSAKSVK